MINPPELNKHVLSVQYINMSGLRKQIPITPIMT